MTEKPERSVLYAVYELLSLEFQSRFFTLTARIWHEHCTNIPKTRNVKKKYIGSSPANNEAS